MPLTLLIPIGIYLLIGFVYAAWILLFGYDKWYWFPINWILGVPVIIMLAYYVVTGKKNPLGRY